MTHSELGANRAIYDAIREIALHRMVNSNGTFKHTARIPGYVVKVHTDPGDELLGTVDVQEYSSSEAAAQAIKDGTPVGLHEGVYLSAIQNNEGGTFILPYLYSDVVIATDPDSLREYVIQYSHADTVQVDAHSKVVVGVTETEEMEMTEDSPDFDELEKTGIHTHTTYMPTSIFHIAATGEEPEKQSTLEMTAEKIEAVRDKASLLMDAEKTEQRFGEKTVETLDADKWQARYDKGTMTLDADKGCVKFDSMEVTVKSDAVYLGKASANEPAVLGNQLAALLVDWLGTLSQMMTPTMMGPQPPVNVAKFAALQAKVNSYKAATSGILTKLVKVAK